MSLLSLLPVVGKILDKVIPDVNARAKAKIALEAAGQSGELDLLLGQLEINKIEAASSSLFVSGWRPAVGWVCASAMAYHFILSPFLDIWFVMPIIKVEQLYPVLMGMLGLGGMRSFEKAKKVASQ